MQIKTKYLLEALSLAMSAINPKHTNPVVQLVKVTTHGMQLAFHGTCNDLFAIAPVQDSYWNEADTLVDPAPLKAFLDKSKDEFTDLSLQGQDEERVLVVTTGRATLELTAGDPEFFPRANETAGDHYTLDAEDAAAMLAMSPAIATDKGRYALNSVMVAATTDGNLWLCCTDGRRLMAATLGEGYELPEERFMSLVPRIMTKGLKAMKGRPDITMRCYQNQVVAESSDGSKLFSGTVEGQYPDIWSVLPKTTTDFVTVSRDELLRVAAQASVGTSVDSSTIDMHVSPWEVSFTSRSSAGRRVTARLPVAGSVAKAQVIGLDPRYVLEILNAWKHLDFQKVTLAWRDNNTGVYLMPSGQSRLIGIIMPLETDGGECVYEFETTATHDWPVEVAGIVRSTFYERSQAVVEEAEAVANEEPTDEGDDVGTEPALDSEDELADEPVAEPVQGHAPDSLDDEPGYDDGYADDELEQLIEEGVVKVVATASEPEVEVEQPDDQLAAA